MTEQQAVHGPQDLTSIPIDDTALDNVVYEQAVALSDHPSYPGYSLQTFDGKYIVLVEKSDIVYATAVRCGLGECVTRRLGLEHDRQSLDALSRIERSIDRLTDAGLLERHQTSGHPDSLYSVRGLLDTLALQKSAKHESQY